uniref:Putative secreted protein n=1 Tax=Anopheles darlingi TaxID=43151 RepID=A0A2M4DPG4_ANODA
MMLLLSIHFPAFFHCTPASLERMENRSAHQRRRILPRIAARPLPTAKKLICRLLFEVGLRLLLYTSVTTKVVVH